LFYGLRTPLYSLIVSVFIVIFVLFYIQLYSPIFAASVWLNVQLSSVQFIAYVHVYQIWFGSVGVCQSYFGQIDFSDPESWALSIAGNRIADP